MRKWVWAVCLGMCLSTSVGCIIPGFSADPIRRQRQLVYVSENLRLALDDWERIWFFDQPSHETPWRTHGGMVP